MKKFFFFFLLIISFNLIFSQTDISQKKHIVVIFDKSGSMKNKITDQKKIITNQLYSIIDSLVNEGDYISLLTHGIESKAENFDNIFRVISPYEYFVFSCVNNFVSR